MRATDMSGTPNNGVGKNTPASWELRLGAIETKLDSGLPFPDENGFDGSVWWMWEERIKEGHHEEVKLIKKIYNPTKNHPYASSSLLDPNDIASENYWDIREVSDSMYAALVVAMWSRMEYFLGNLSSIYDEAFKGKKFQQDQSFRFGEIIKNLKPVNIEKCEKYLEINALRILNNSYKHASGYYKPIKDKSYTIIDPHILSTWKIMNEKTLYSIKLDHSNMTIKIKYYNLPIKKIVLDCYHFCSESLDKTKIYLYREKFQH
jgi:hypothetical protein